MFGELNNYSLSWFQIQVSEPTKIHFKSNLFGSFGAGLVTPINTIDFGNVFDNVGQKLIDNIRVVATIAVLLIAFIPFGVICRKLDKRDSFKVNNIMKSISLEFNEHTELLRAEIFPPSTHCSTYSFRHLPCLLISYFTTSILDLFVVPSTNYVAWGFTFIPF